MIRPLLLMLLLAGCATRPHSIASAPPPPPETHVPAYATRRFEPFTRTTAVAIALREWRAFGQVVDDDPPGSHPLASYARPDHQPALWQRVGDYWWSGPDPDSRVSDWTGKYDDSGTPYAPRDVSHAWSAAFISYVMRVSGAGDQFRYSALHADYINAASQGLNGMRAERPGVYAPQPGDLICLGRGAAHTLRFDDLPAAPFPGHCDIVVAAAPGQLTVVGGNVAAGVTMKHVPTTAEGLLAGPDGAAVDPRYEWFVVVRPGYETTLG